MTRCRFRPCRYVGLLADRTYDRRGLMSNRSVGIPMIEPLDIVLLKWDNTERNRQPFEFDGATIMLTIC